MPEFFKYIALCLAAFYFVIWLHGGIVYTSLPNSSLGGADTKVYYFIGWAILLAYIPFYLYRVKIEDPKHEGETGAAAPATTGGD
jgi:predicted secreted protein